MHLSDRRSYLRSEHLGPCARARAKNPHIFKKQAEEKKERRKKITRTFHRSDSNRRRSNFGGRSRRSNGRGGTDHGGSCLRGGEHFFFSLLSDTEKRSARGEYDAFFFFFFFFFEREFFSSCVDKTKEREQRALFHSPKDFCFVLSLAPEKETTRFVFCFCFFSLSPFSGTQKHKIQKKVHHCSLLFTHLCTNRQTRARLQPRTTTINKRSLCFWGNRRRRRRRTISTHTDT